MPPPPRHAHEERYYRSTILRITEAQTCHLFAEYEMEQCLWNTSLEDYPNTIQRLKAYRRIAQKLNIPNFTAKHVKLKCKNIRNSYCQELKKMMTKECYTPTVFWFALLDSFLRPHVLLKKSLAPSQEPEPSPEHNQHVDTGIDDSDECDDPLSSEQKSNLKVEIESDDEVEVTDWVVGDPTRRDASYLETSSIEPTTSEEPQDDNKDSISTNAKKRKRLSNNEENIYQDYNYDEPQAVNNTTTGVFDEVPSPAVQLVTQTHGAQKDCYDAFGSYIASLLRTLPPHKALMIQPKIVELIVSTGAAENK